MRLTPQMGFWDAQLLEWGAAGWRAEYIWLRWTWRPHRYLFMGLH